MEKIIVVSGPVIVENNKVLLNISGKDNFWKFCGGTVKKNESLIETANREVGEEMGIKIQVINDQPFIVYKKKSVDDKEIEIILVHWLATHKGDIKPGHEVKEWLWADINNLPKGLAPNIIPALTHFGFLTEN